MTDNRDRLTRILRIVMAVSVALVLFSVAGDLLGDRVPWLARANEYVERGIVLGLVGIFGFVLLAFVLQFLSDLRGGIRIPSEAVLVLRRPRGVGAILPLAMVLVLVGGLVTLAFLPEDTLADFDLQNPFTDDLAFEFKAMIALFAGIAAFLIVAFTVRAVVNPPWFVLSRHGFLYRPGDVSAGLVRWSEISGIKPSEVLSGDGGYGPSIKPVLVVTLKHPERYNANYTPLLRLMLRVLTPALRAQTGGGDIFIDPSDFGADYDKVVALMREYSGLEIDAS
jgi:hypothetical protein